MGSKIDTSVEEKKQSRLVNGTAREVLKVARRRKEDLREKVLEASYLYLRCFAHGRYSWSEVSKTASKGA